MAAGALAVIGGIILIMVVAGLIVFGGAYALLNLTLSYLPYFIVLAVAGIIITRLSDGGGITRGEAGLLGTGAGILEGMRENRTEGNENRDRGTQSVNSPQAQISPSNPDPNNEGSQAQTSRGNEDAVAFNPINQHGGGNGESHHSPYEGSIPENSTNNNSSPRGDEYLNQESPNNNMGFFDSARERLTGEGKTGRAEDKELHELVQKLDQEEQVEGKLQNMDEEMKQELSELIHEMEDFLQHEERFKEIMNGSSTIGEIMQHQEEIGQDIRAMNSDLAQIKNDFEVLREDINERNQREKKVEELEEAETNLMDDLLQKHRRIEKMQKNVNNLVTHELDLGGYDQT